MLEKGLEDATEKLSGLLESATIGEPERRASLYAALGNAFQTLGERESGTASLEQAVQAYRAALEVFTVEDLSRHHNIAQNNLQKALMKLQARRAEPGPVTAPN